MSTSRGVAQSVQGLLWGEVEAEEENAGAVVSVAAMAGGDGETERSDEHARESTRD